MSVVEPERDFEIPLHPPLPKGDLYGLLRLYGFAMTSKRTTCFLSLQYYDSLKRGICKRLGENTVKLKRSGILTGTAGVYFVASKLAAKGFHAAPTFGNAPNVDILVGLPDGAANLSLQVKTSMHATRAKGRGDNRKWHHYEWDLGTKSAGLNQPGLFFAFVNLKGMGIEMPDVFIVPSKVIHDRFEKQIEAKQSRIRWHPGIEAAEPFKNNWESLREYLLKASEEIHDTGRE